MPKTIPRLDTDEVQRIIADESMSNNEKARAIHRFDYNQSCLDTDGYLKSRMSIKQIESLLEEL